MNNRLKLGVLGCFLIVIVLSHPHQASLGYGQGELWTDWTSYTYRIGEDGIAHVTVTSYISTDESTLRYLLDFFDRNRETQLKHAEDMIAAQETVMANRLGRKLSSRDIVVNERVVDNLLVVETRWTWNSFAVRQGNSWLVDALSVTPANLQENGNLTVVLPRSVDVISVYPNEDRREIFEDDVLLVWDGPKEGLAPTIEFRTFWDRYQPWLMYGALAIVAVSVIAVYATRTRRRARRSTQVGPRVKGIGSAVDKPRVKSIQETGKRPRVLRVDEE